ncbi:hypothetical protein ACA910_016256 [Epithemia clementina (nom. ined.)]
MRPFTRVVPASKFFKVQTSVGVKETTLKGILDPTAKGLTCPAPSPNDDIQWRSLTPETSMVAMCSQVSFCRQVCRRSSLEERGKLLDLPQEILKTREGVPRLENWLAARPPPFKARAEVLRQFKLWSWSGYPSGTVKAHASFAQQNEEVRDDGRLGAPQFNEKGPADPASSLSDTSMVPFPLTNEETEALGVASVKATKSNNAAIPTHLWDDRILRRYKIKTNIGKAQMKHALEV